MTSTLTALAPASGLRAVRDAIIHDVDDKAHKVAVDYPICVDSYRSDFGPGAFEDGWRRQLPVMCHNHDQNALIGRAVSAQSLSDRHRVVGKFSDFDDVPAARAAFSNIRDGIYPGWSFHFVDGHAVPHPCGERSTIRYRSARMLEFGPVLMPSIPGTRVVDLRSSGLTPAEQFELEVLAAVAAQEGRRDLEGYIADVDAARAHARQLFNLRPSSHQRRQAAIAGIGTTLARIARGSRRR